MTTAISMTADAAPGEIPARTVAGAQRRPTRMRVQCCVCRRERTAFGWRFVAEDPMASYSDTYCPVCFAKALEELDAPVRGIPGAYA
jgi:hypothetical protein